MTKAKIGILSGEPINQAKSNKLFHCIMAMLCLDLLIFNFWLFYPGFIETDWVMVSAYLGMDNHYPVIYPFLLQYIFQIFGKHIYISLLFNLIPFYLGIYVLMLGCWKRFNSPWCLSAILPLCIGNLYFNNIILHSSFSSPMLIFLLWMLVLYQLMVGITYKNSLAVLIAFIFATISRHNAIVQVYPIFFIYACIAVCKLNTGYKKLYYIGLLIVSAIFSIAVSLGIPYLLKTGQKPISSPIYLHQIAGACVPNHDDSCFEPTWYIPGKTYEDAEKAYNAEPMNADYMNTPWKKNCPFRYEILPDLKILWLKAILKYPYDYCRYVLRFIKKLWTIETMTNLHPDDPHYSSNITNIQWLKSIFPSEELFYKPSSFKLKLYNILYAVFPKIKTSVYIALNFIMLLGLSVLLLKRKNIFILYSLSSALAGVGGAVIFSIFSPDIVWRYIYPVLASTTVAVIGIVIYLIDEKNSLQEIKRKIDQT